MHREWINLTKIYIRYKVNIPQGYRYKYPFTSLCNATGNGKIAARQNCIYYSVSCMFMFTVHFKLPKNFIWTIIQLVPLK